MLITSRAAADVLATRVPTFEQARALLRTGAAGPATTIGNAVAYDAARVQELATRPWVDEHALAARCSWGVHVARLPRSASVDVEGPWSDQAAAIADRPTLPPMTAATIGVRIKVSGGLPWVATVSGFVVFGAEATGWTEADHGDAAFVLRPPGDWFELAERRWFAFGRGRHWFFWDPWRLQQ